MPRAFALALLLGGVPVIEAQSKESDTLAERWFSCPAPIGIFAETPPAANPEAKPGETALTADKASSLANGKSYFSGNVVVERDGRILRGDEARYDPKAQQIDVEGNVAFYGGSMVMHGERATMSMQQESGEFDGVAFHFPERHAFGQAGKLTFKDANRSVLKDVQYTTCSPGHEDWRLNASKLKLDQESNTGEAYNTVVRFKSVPVFYSPYLNFPLSGRKSGLLPPTIGSSEDSGTDVQLPYYWNIAPNYDATFTPRYLSKRGAMLMSEFRLLTEHTEGEVKGDFLSDDELYGEDRHYLALDHLSRFDNGWSSDLTYHRASDELYLKDLGGYGDNTSSHLQQRLDIQYRDEYWHFLARAENYQALSGDTPYRRLPQLKLNGQSSRKPNQLQFAFESEAVIFDHDDEVTTGSRVDLKPSLSLPLQGAAWYLKPTAAWRYTHYNLENTLIDEELSRSLPILTLDSGLFFERDTVIANKGLTQTLEPRLFYLAVPHEDQNALPLFDTDHADFRFNQLFRDNRFVGADRQGDANQLTAALTTRFIDNTDGRERLRASIGRTQYYEDREVGLNVGDPIETEEYSDLFAEIEAAPTNALRLGISSRFDTDRERSEELNGRIRYQPDNKRLLSLDYRYDETELLQQTDTLMFWPVARQWQLLGRWRYDLDNAENLDLLAGVEYQSCCWSLRLIGRNHRDTINDDLERSIYLTFELKGLGGLGGRLEDALEEGLLSYE